MTKRAGLLRVSITKNVTVNVTKVYDGWLQILIQKRDKFLLIFFLKFISTIRHESMETCDGECDKSLLRLVTNLFLIKYQNFGNFLNLVQIQH